MRSFIFLWVDDFGNHCLFQADTGSYNEAWDKFNAEHGQQCYAVIEGSNMEVREFNP